MNRIYTERSETTKIFTRFAVGACLGFSLSRLLRTSLRTQGLSAAIGGASLIALPKFFVKNSSSNQKPKFSLEECTPKNLKEFAAKVFEKQQGNAVFSPLSLWLLLRQVSHGAASHIQEDLKSVIGEDALLAGHIKSLHLHLQNAGLKLANLCLHKHGLQQTFKSQLDAYMPQYGKLTDDSAEEVKRVNKWVEKHTGGMIPTILEPDEITPQTIAVLANAVAYTGKWQSQFEKTEQELFGGNSVPMMKQTHLFLYGQNDKFEFLKVFYEGETFSRIFMLPKGNTPLTEALTQDLQSSMFTKRRVEFWLPKNKTEQEIDVIELLDALNSELNIGTKLKAENSLPKMAETENSVSLGLCRHKATIEDDEKGTKASAATVATVLEKAMLSPLNFHCDRPYAHVILHEKSQLPIFVGCVRELGVGE